ncbi:MAG: hypothetical protein H0V92_04595 [Pseudonocardiales bacterium]|nr:hypothetical protein [Pseudonocardiales bacterium]
MGPPVGRALHYSVFARAKGGRWSRPASADVRVVPPVSDVVIEGGEKAVTAHWRAHPDVAAVEVTRTTGGAGGPSETIAVEHNRAFGDLAVGDGVRYHYTIIACYLTATGVLRSEAVVVRGATRPEARPVTKLTASAVDGPGLAVKLSWRQRTGSEVVVRRSPRPCPWDYGQTVELAELARYGVELHGALIEKGESVTLTVAVPSGRSYCVPFTIGPKGAVRGQDAIVDLTEPVRHVQAQRFGDDVRITWTWPDEVSAAEVVWDGGRRRITRQQYREEGGCQIHGVPRVTRVDVGAVVPGAHGESESRSAPISVEVEQRPPRLAYQIRRRGHRLVGGVKCTVTVTGVEVVGEVTLLLVAAAGAVMPQKPDGGLELLRTSITVAAGVPTVLPEVEVPSVMRKPYWLRCFIAEPAGALLTDPPVSQLKVS